MTNKSVKGKVKASRRVFTPQEKCQAVLSVWSDRRTPRDICQEMGINWAMLNQWQQRAIAGMMDALKPRRQSAADKGPLLGSRLEKLLDRTSRQRSKACKLNRRLETMQSGKPST